ncbi:hypothetical protein [Haloprofundus salilacus]|uniref:hypothetical protein n=1 Tax=Haloprofundus salilacus TaxID=2876190 RepID=UPI001CCE4E90|nr:hypothetical protein [Haloprofundus salilacus]
MSESEQRRSISEGSPSASKRQSSATENVPSATENVPSSPEDRTSLSEPEDSLPTTESPPSVSVTCPSCGDDVSAALALTDGGLASGTSGTSSDSLLSSDGGISNPEDELCGKSVHCRSCGEAFELLFYPE